MGPVELPDLSHLRFEEREHYRELLEIGLQDDVEYHKRKHGDDAIAALIEIVGQMEINAALAEGGRPCGYMAELRWWNGRVQCTSIAQNDMELSDLISTIGGQYQTTSGGGRRERADKRANSVSDPTKKQF